MHFVHKMDQKTYQRGIRKGDSFSRSFQIQVVLRSVISRPKNTRVLSFFSKSAWPTLPHSLVLSSSTARCPRPRSVHWPSSYADAHDGVAADLCSNPERCPYKFATGRHTPAVGTDRTHNTPPTPDCKATNILLSSAVQVREATLGTVPGDWCVASITFPPLATIRIPFF